MAQLGSVNRVGVTVYNAMGETEQIHRQPRCEPNTIKGEAVGFLAFTPGSLRSQPAVVAFTLP